MIKLFSFPESLIKARLIHLFHGLEMMNTKIFFAGPAVKCVLIWCVLILIINIFKVIIQFDPFIFFLQLCEVV